MPNDVMRFRDRARDCLNLSKSARSDVDRTMLEDIAAELNVEADRIEAEHAAKLPANEP